MERMGWRFWRCWASSFALDPKGCMADLVSTLTARGIGPMAREARRNIYTEHRVVEASEPGKPEVEPTQAETDLVVNIGDRVLVSYNDDPAHQVTLLSSDPAARALLGATVDDEVSIPAERGDRRATIIAIDKMSLKKAVGSSPIVRDSVVSPPGLPLKAHEMLPPQSPAAPKPAQLDFAKTQPVSDRGRPPASRAGTGANRVLEQLRALDERLRNPRCPQCSRVAHLAITNEGVVITCKECKKVERVATETLQRLAERLSAVCYSCKGGPLKSAAGPFGNYLRCRNCGANNSWQVVSERIRKN